MMRSAGEGALEFLEVLFATIGNQRVAIVRRCVMELEKSMRKIWDFWEQMSCSVTFENNVRYGNK